MSSYTSALGGKRSIRRDIRRRTIYKLQTAAEEIGEKLAGVEGITAVDDGLEETDSEFHFTVDKKSHEKRSDGSSGLYAGGEGSYLRYHLLQLSWEGDNYDVVVSNP